MYTNTGLMPSVCCFVSENLVRMDSPHFIDHRLVGKYFQSFEGTYFLSNDEKAREYPEDREFVERMEEQNI